MFLHLVLWRKVFTHDVESVGAPSVAAVELQKLREAADKTAA
jgi:hypothetical protein